VQFKCILAFHGGLISRCAEPHNAERQLADPATGREVLVEFQQIGNAVTVTAMDTKSMVEVSIMGPATAGEDISKRNVINKLNYVLSKKD
jgi:hypothetical protein